MSTWKNKISKEILEEIIEVSKMIYNSCNSLELPTVISPKLYEILKRNILNKENINE